MAVQTPVPRGKSFLLPVASIMRLFKLNNGRQGIAVRSAPSNLDIAASRTDDRIFLHVLNMECRHSVEAEFAVLGRQTVSGRVIEIAPSDLRANVSSDEPETFKPVQKEIAQGTPLKWRFPPASVSVVELAIKPVPVG